MTMNTREMITIMQLQGGAKIVRARYLNSMPAAPAAPAGAPRRHVEPGSYDHNYDPTYSSDSVDTQGTYCFKNVIGLDLEVDSIVMCETNDSYALLKVTDPNVRATDVSVPLSELKHVVATVDNAKFKQIKESENVAHHQLALSEVTERLTTYKDQVGATAYAAVGNILGLPSDVPPAPGALNEPLVADMSTLIDAEVARRMSGDGGSAA